MKEARLPRTTRLFFWWADRAWVQSFVFIGLSMLAWTGYRHPDLAREWVAKACEFFDTDSIPDDLLVKSSEETPRPVSNQKSPPNIKPFQVSGGQCILVASIDETSPHDFFTQESLRAMEQVIGDIQAMPQIDHLLWLDNVPGFNLFGLPGELLPSSNSSPRQLSTARQRVLDNPLAVGQLISSDGKTLLIHLNLDWFFITSDDDATIAIRQKAEAAVAAVAPNSPIRFQITGQVPLHLMTVNNHVHDSTKYQMIAYLIMLISALVLFRGLSAVLIVAAAPAVGVFWTMGILCFFDLQDNPFNDIIVPVLISLVGLTDSVHLMVEIRNQRASGLSTREAARQGISRVGLACMLTSLTTAIGFVSLTWAHHEIVQDFGWCCVVGVLMTFTSVLTIVPLGCRSPLGRRLHVGLGKSLIDHQLRRIEPIVNWVLKHDRPVSWLAIIATVVLAAVSWQLQPDEKRYSGLSESGEAAQALRHLDVSLGGTEFAYLDIDWSLPSQQGEALQVIGKLDRLLKDDPLIGNPIGIHSLLNALPGDGTPEERMTLLELLPPELKRAFYQPEQQRAWIQFRVQDRGIAAYGPSFTRIENTLVQLRRDHPGLGLSLGGNAVWRWRNIYQIVTDLATSLGTASIVIWIVLTIMYRSIRVGLISIVPNLFPLVVTASMLVLGGLHLEMVTVCVFTICVGIAVDDTIHFLTRYQEEQQTGGDHQAVIRRAFTGVGTALLMTTIVLVTGLGSAILGDSRDARLFGIMGCLTLSAALFADILLLPALLSRFARSKDQPEAASGNDAV